MRINNSNRIEILIGFLNILKLRIIKKIIMEYEVVGAIKIKDGLFLGDEIAA